MTETFWRLDKDVVALTINGKIHNVTAKDIFLAEFKNSSINSLSVCRPSEALPDITFTKYPVELAIYLEAEKAEGSAVLKCVCKAVINNTQFQVPDPVNRFHDHMVHDGTWHPFAAGSLETAKEIFLEVGVEPSGYISLKQYIQLLKYPSTLISIIDNTQNAANAVYVNASPIPIIIPGFTGQMFPYQADGYKWLSMIADQSIGCILADQMGLGKTLQIIAVLVGETARKVNPSLVIAPATLLENWRREIAKFALGLKVLLHQGAQRTGFSEDLARYDVVVTSYDAVLRDMSLLQLVEWNLVILDEAQAIKNPGSQRSRCVKELPRRVSIAVTGTPVENSLGDLWSLMDFAMPGLLGRESEFLKQFDDDVNSAEKLEPLVSPFILRRTVARVAKDLPDCIDIPQALEMDEESISEYDAIREEAVKEYGAAAGLVSIQRLRMFCTHPRLTHSLPSPDLIKVSLKYKRLLEILDEVFSNNEKAIIFTSYSVMTDLLYQDLPKQFGGIHIDFIDGRVEVKERQPKVDRFSVFEGPGVLILNPRAAGTGLNITAANHVIHYNPEWNPALEDQASARAYRRGQTKTVTIHRLFYINTVEEIINERLERKRTVADFAVVGVKGENEELDDILRALKMSPKIGGIK